MKALKAQSACERFVRSSEPFVDGELDPGHMMDMEEHLAVCDECAGRASFSKAMRISLGKQRASVRAPDALRARICATMATERESETAGDGVTSPKLIGLRYATALAAAAGVVFAIGMARNQGGAPIATPTEGAVRADISPDSWLDDFVALHANPLPPETTNPEELQNFDRFIGVPVRRPAAFQPLGAKFKGARVNATSDRRTAVLEYTMHGQHRVTMYVFSTSAVTVKRSTRLSPRIVRERPIYVGRMRGYAVAAVEQGGVGYAIASDLDDEESANMMVAAVSP